jgi:ABC-2 type transport system permease protein
VTTRPSLAIAGVAVRRLFRDRSNIFFVFIFPLLLILLIGAQFGGQTGDLTLAVTATGAGPLGEDLVGAIEEVDGVEVERRDDAAGVDDAVARGGADGGLVVPSGYDEALRTSPDGVVLEYIGRPDSFSPALQAVVVPAIAEQNTRITLADLVVVVDDGVSYEQALAQSDAARGVLPEVGVARTEVGTDELAQEFSGLGQFDLGAVQQLNLFVFLSALTNAAALLQSREYGVTRRLLAHPVSAGQVVRGEALGRYGVAMVQGLYIVLGTLLLFRVDWGDPLSALTILALFAAVAAGAGLLLGAVARTQAQAGAIGVGLGIAIAAIGGSMLPVELIPDGMAVVSRLTPHYWSYEAFAEVVRRGGTVVDVLPELGVLALQAVVLLGLAGVMLRRTLTR